MCTFPQTLNNRAFILAESSRKTSRLKCLLTDLEAIFFTTWEKVWCMLHLEMHVVSMLNSQHLQ